MVDYGHRYTENEYAISPEMTLGLDVRETLIAEPLSKAGYVCGAIGKWDTGRARRFLPLQHGFQFFYGFPTTGIDYWTHERYGIPSLYRNNDRIKEEGYATDLFCREALNFIKSNRDRPFFLYLAFNAPHASSNLDRQKRLALAPPETLALYPEISSPAERARYACITRMDEAVGKVLDLLDSEKLAQNTLVLFFSAYGHGGMSQGVTLNTKRTQLFDGDLRSAFLARWPGKIPAGTTRSDFVTGLEIFPTLLAAAEVAPPAGLVLDGFDMLPVLTGEKPSPRQDMLWLYHGKKAARVGNFKWVESENGHAVFDVAHDEGEQHDVSGERPELVKQLKSRFESWQREMEASEPRGPFRDY
jgi:arylsulfatase A-like enzyme